MSRIAQRVAESVAESAIRFAEPFVGATADIESLSVLDKAVAGADAVVLGELNHFVHEKSDFRLFFCRYLLSRGVTVFAEELGVSDGVRIDRFLASGDNTELKRLPSFGYEKHKRTDRDDRPTGILRRSFDAYPTGQFVAEQVRFYQGLRAAASTIPLRYFGFDIDGSPGGAYEDIARILEGKQDTGIEKLRAGLARVPGESLDDEALRLRKAKDGLVAIPQLSDADRQSIDHFLSALIDSLEYVGVTYEAMDYVALRPGMAMREDAMKRRMADIATATSAAKIALMGHALHLVKNDAALGAVSGVGPGGGLTSSLGHHLARGQGRRMLSIWFMYGAGEDSQPFPDLPRYASYPDDTLNAALSCYDAPLFFTTDDPVFGEPVKLGHMYNSVIKLPLAAQVDAMFYIPKISPLRSS